MSEVATCGEKPQMALVAQLGARRHYAVPLAFMAQGRLSRFHTDFYIKSKLLRNITAMGGRFGLHGLGRLSGRSEIALSATLVTAHRCFGLAQRWRLRRARSTSERTAAWIHGGRRFCEIVSRDLNGNEGLVFAYTSTAKELFHKARQAGIPTCLDHATAPRVIEMNLVREESERFPGWALHDEIDAMAAEYQHRQIEELALADVVVCGSSFVRGTLESLGIGSGKLRIVPLGFFKGVAATETVSGGKKFRVLFVGGEGLRKGIGYLARALEMTGSASVEARVAGNLEISEMGMAELRRNMTLLGPVPRTEIGQLYRWAEVLVLPSISDTFGLVILEAMAAGVPVITTPHTCGPDIIREGIDGFIVPIRDAEAIADRIDRLAGNRELLAAMSRQARERAGDFTINRYAERLMAAVSAGKEN